MPSEKIIIFASEATTKICACVGMYVCMNVLRVNPPIASLMSHSLFGLILPINLFKKKYDH